MFPWSFAQEIQDKYERALAAAPELLQRLAFVIMMMVVNHVNLSSIPWSAAAADLRDLRSTHEPRRLGSHYPAFVDTAGLEGSECTSHQPFVNQQRRSWTCYGTRQTSLLMVSNGHARGGSKLKAPVSTSVQSGVTLYLGPLPLGTATKQNALDCVCALTRLRGQ